MDKSTSGSQIYVLSEKVANNIHSVQWGYNPKLLEHTDSANK